jgi:hypothetical protein
MSSGYKGVIKMYIIKRGKYYKVYPTIKNGISYYCIANIKTNEFLWAYRNKEQAIEKFKKIEKWSKIHGVL